MKLSNLRRIRIAVSLFLFLSMLFLFLATGRGILDPVANVLLHLQLLPSLLSFFALFFSITTLGFVLIILLTLVFGRVYCSSICPLGTFQDIMIAFSRLFKSRKNRRFNYTSNRKRLLRYGVLAATLIFWISGSLFLINLLDPYSNFGKISVSLFKPAYIWITNSAAFLLEGLDIFLISPRSMHTLPFDVILVSGIVFLVISIMAVWRGRLFCNTLCPAGSILGLLSLKPLYRIVFNEKECTFCRKCEWVCKAECLNSRTHEVDYSRCINCFNCFSACPNEGLQYKPVFALNKTEVKQPLEGKASPDEKRQFMLTLVTGMLSIPLISKLARSRPVHTDQPGMVPIENQKVVTPPGSLSHDHFTSNCIACYLCVSACPTKVIVPSFFDYGLAGFMQPKLDYHKNFCNFDCVRCTEVCPTGAITKQSEEEKKLIKIGDVRFLAESCIVTVNRTDCGACSEHCPTKAVQMVPYEDGLFIPEVYPEICVGCGACEYACPTTPFKAIYVTGLPVHQEAVPIEDADGPREDDADDFPF